MAQADLLDTALSLAGVLATAPAIGGGLGITGAVLCRRPNWEVELWGYWGTAVGCVTGLVLAVLIVAVS